MPNTLMNLRWLHVHTSMFFVAVDVKILWVRIAWIRVFIYHFGKVVSCACRYQVQWVGQSWGKLFIARFRVPSPPITATCVKECAAKS